MNKDFLLNHVCLNTYLYYASYLEVYVGVAPVTKFLALGGHFGKKKKGAAISYGNSKIVDE